MYLLLLAGVLCPCSALEAAEPGPGYIGTNPDLVEGGRALEQDRFAEGVELTLRGLKIELGSQDRAAALSNLCAGYSGLGKYDLAIVNCSASIAIDPDNWRAYNNRAVAYLYKGQLHLASRDVRAGLALAPESATLKKVELIVNGALAAPRRRAEASDPLA